MSASDVFQRALDDIAQAMRSGAAPVAILSHVAEAILRVQRILLTRHLVDMGGLMVNGGPFRGMKYIPESAGSALSPKLLGSYEAELHETIRDIAAKAPTDIVNIGCGEGYYAVGLAKLIPAARVLAFDIDPHSQELCREVANINGVADRVTIKGECTTASLRPLARPGTLIFCDCEGAELTLLDPQAVPELGQCSIIVEMHNCFDPMISTRIVERFGPTHDIRVLESSYRDPRDYPLLRRFTEFDQNLLMCEFRPGPTPWAVMTPRGR